MRRSLAARPSEWDAGASPDLARRRLCPGRCPRAGRHDRAGPPVQGVPASLFPIAAPLLAIAALGAEESVVRGRRPARIEDAGTAGDRWLGAGGLKRRHIRSTRSAIPLG